MDFDRIFPLIIIMIVWGIGAVMRNLPKKEQQDSASVKQPPGFFKILQQVRGLFLVADSLRVAIHTKTVAYKKMVFWFFHFFLLI